MKFSARERSALNRVSILLEHYGLLLESDKKFPSVVNIIVRKPVIGSWWGHPSGKLIWTVSNNLAESSDVLLAKLVSRKVTLIHRKLWRNVIAVGTSRDDWQINSLSPEAMELLHCVDERGKVRTDRLANKEEKSVRMMTSSDAVRELEYRLLVQSEEVHTESGAHARILQSWQDWASSRRLKGKFPHVSDAKAKLEKLIQRMNKNSGAKGKLPWQ